MARRPLIWLVLIIWLAFGLRIHQLGSSPLRGDEAFSALNWAGRPLAESLSLIAPIEPHPPLVYAIFRFWRHWIGGIESPLTLRLLPALCSLPGLAAAFSLGRRLTGRHEVGMAAALLWAAHPYLVWHSQDFRNYALWAGFSALSLAAGLRLLDAPSRRNWLIYALAAAASAFLFYTESFLMASLWLFALYRKRDDRRFLTHLLCLQATIAGALLLAFLLLQAPLLLSGAYPGNVAAFQAGDTLTRFLPALVMGEILPAPLSSSWLLIDIALALLLLLIARQSRLQAVFIALTGLTPLLLLGMASQRLDIFDPRYALAAAIAFILLIACGSHHLAFLLSGKLGIRRNWLLALLMLPWLLLSLAGLNSYFNDAAQRKSPAWDELGAFLNQRVQAGELVINQSADPAFDYYYRGSADSLALPTSPNQARGDIMAELEALDAGYDSIWLAANPNWENGNLVEKWLREHRQPVTRSHASGLAISQYLPWHVDDAGEPPLARFGGTIELLSFQFSPQPLPTGELPLWIHWRLLNAQSGALKSFAHIYGPENPATGGILWTQADQVPGAGRPDGWAWSRGQIIREVYVLPAADLPAGDYELAVGWYDAISGARLLNERGADHVLLSRFNFAPPGHRTRQ